MPSPSNLSLLSTSTAVDIEEPFESTQNEEVRIVDAPVMVEVPDVVAVHQQTTTAPPAAVAFSPLAVQISFDDELGKPLALQPPSLGVYFQQGNVKFVAEQTNVQIEGPHSTFAEGEVVIVFADGTHLTTHKALLAAHSQYMKKILEVVPDGEIVDVSPCTREDFTALLNFVYPTRMPIFKDLKDRIRAALAFQVTVVYACSRYSVDYPDCSFEFKLQEAIKLELMPALEELVYRTSEKQKSELVQRLASSEQKVAALKEIVLNKDAEIMELKKRECCKCETADVSSDLLASQRKVKDLDTRLTIAQEELEKKCAENAEEKMRTVIYRSAAAVYKQQLDACRGHCVLAKMLNIDEIPKFYDSLDLAKNGRKTE